MNDDAAKLDEALKDYPHVLFDIDGRTHAAFRELQPNKEEYLINILRVDDNGEVEINYMTEERFLEEHPGIKVPFSGIGYG